MVMTVEKNEVGGEHPLDYIDVIRKQIGANGSAKDIPRGMFHAQRGTSSVNGDPVERALRELYREAPENSLKPDPNDPGITYGLLGDSR